MELNGPNLYHSHSRFGHWQYGEFIYHEDHHDWLVINGH